MSIRLLLLLLLFLTPHASAEADKYGVLHEE